MRLIEAHKGRVCALAYSPDGKLLASGGEDRKVRIWEVAGGAERTVLKPHSGCIYALAFTPDGQFIASGGGRNELFVWNHDTLSRTQFTDHRLLVSAVEFTPDGQLMVSAEGNVFDSTFGGQIRAWDMKKWQELRSKSIAGGAWALAIDPAGVTLAVGSGGHRIELRKCSELRNAGMGKPVMLDTKSAVRGVAFSPDGQFVAAATAWSVQVWSVQDRALQHTLRGHKNIVWGVAYSRDGQRLFSGSEDGLVKVWDAVTGAELQSYDWRIGKVRAIAVAPDGLTAAAAADGAVAVWDIEE